MYRDVKKISILGSTGSIGVQTVEVCRALGIRPVCLSARRNIKLLEAQAREFLPGLVAVEDSRAAGQLKVALSDTPVKVISGKDALLEASTHPEADVVVGAIVGIAGLPPTLEAARAGKRIAIANKEPLVAGGEILTRAVSEGGGELIPVDSEHSAIFQCLGAGRREDVAGLLLTASGGPFFGRSRSELVNITPNQATTHPNWKMGAKITVDSATLMNKGLELIEAVRLFGVTPKQIEVVIHRQSILHSAVYFRDGSLIGQMGLPDMRTAIQYAISYPNRLEVRGQGRLSLTDVATLTFERPDRETFECLAACERAIELGGLYPAAVNSAGEAAVALFLGGRLDFLRIGELVNLSLEKLKLPGAVTFENIMEVDNIARSFIKENA